MPGVILSVPLTTSGVAVLPIEQGIPLGSPGVWTVTVRFGDTPIGSKTVLITNGTTASTGSQPQRRRTGTPTSAGVAPEATTTWRPRRRRRPLRRRASTHNRRERTGLATSSWS